LGGAAGLEEIGGGLVRLPHEVEVLQRGLAGPAAAAAGKRAGVGAAEAPRLQLNLVLVLVVGGLTFDAFDLQGIVYVCHVAILRGCCAPFQSRSGPFEAHTARMCSLLL